MDIKINAQNRYVEVNGIEGLEPGDAMALVYGMWVETSEDAANELVAGSSASTERAEKRMGFAYFGDGERADVK